MLKSRDIVEVAIGVAHELNIELMVDARGRSPFDFALMIYQGSEKRYLALPEVCLYGTRDELRGFIKFLLDFPQLVCNQ